MIIKATRAILRLGIMGTGQRGLNTGQITLSRASVHRMLLREDGSQRKKSHMNFGLPRVGEAPMGMVEGGSKKIKVPKNSARLRNLNKVYLDKITDILSTGELAILLYGRGLELSKVCIHPNLHGINVYWVTSGSPEQDQDTERLLQSHVKTVRHELSNLRVLGHSPPITFLRDDRQHKLLEVERLLAIADFGEDFEPTDPAHHLKAGLPTLAMPLDARFKTAIEGLEGKDGQEGKEDSPDPFEEALRIAASDPPQEEGVSDVIDPYYLPTMRGEVLGVNTSKIHAMVQQSMKRARAEHRRQDEAGSLGNPLDFHPQESMSPFSTNRKQDIHQWASRYRQMRRKEARKKNKDDALLSYPGSLPSQDLEEQEIEVEWVEDEDYIDTFEK